MGFAGAYLQKSALRGAWVAPPPHPGLKLAVCIPAYNEPAYFEPAYFEPAYFEPAYFEPASSFSGSGLLRCLDALFSAAAKHRLPDFHAEVLIFINASSGAPPEALKQNKRTLEACLEWIHAHAHPSLDFHVWLDHSFGRKEAGVGVARKILMDEAVRRFSLLDRPEGILVSLDADTLVEDNYFQALAAHFSEIRTASFSRKSPEGCSIRFRHPRSAAEDAAAPTFPEAVYQAAAQYEDHLEYYLQQVRSTGYPWAYHTVGSAFAVRAGVYVKEGGMNRRQGGEDFYFIQKVAQRGHWSECNSTCVHPSPRPSNRVPFGTGPVVRRLSEESAGLRKDQAASAQGHAGMLYTYHPEPFRMLRSFFSGLDGYFDKNMDTAGVMTQAHPLLQEFLAKHDFAAALEEIRANSSTLPAFRKRFWRWFNMFRILKFLHFARENGFPDMPLPQALQESGMKL